MSYIPPPRDDSGWQTQRPADEASTGTALARSLVASGGALVGGLLAVPVAGVLFVALFERVGVRIMESVVSGAFEDVSGIEDVIAAIFLMIAAVMIAVIVVGALVAPVFLVLPMTAVAVSLRLTKAGFIMRTVWLTLVTVLVLAAGVLMVAKVADVQLKWWAILPVLAIGGFLGRYIVELSWPGRAGLPDRSVVGTKWKRLTVAWLVIMLVGAVAAVIVVFLAAEASPPG
jgi:hypothetical protein